MYPPRFRKLGIRRDGLSFTYGDIFNKGHGGYIDIWTLEIIVGSNGGLQIPRKQKSRLQPKVQVGQVLFIGLRMSS